MLSLLLKMYYNNDILHLNNNSLYLKIIKKDEFLF
jgi:hypothetical protein